MSALKAIGIAIALVSGALHLATYRPSVLRAATAALLASPALLMVPLIRGLTGSLVNPMAAIWGMHMSWKITLAGALHVLYPITVISVALIATRLLRGPILKLEVSTDGARGATLPTTKRSALAGALSLAALPLILFVGNSAFMLVESLTEPSLTSVELLAQAQVSGWEWLLLHPSGSIHHAYAATTFFYAGLATAMLFILADPMARKAVQLFGRPHLMRAISSIVSISGIVIAIWG
jgi:hypothetical protein